jgi:plasmid stabilization system protein ParE
MPRGSKSKYSSKQKRKAEHIEEGYEKRGTSSKEAERRAWATVNKMDKGGKKSGSGRGKKQNKSPSGKAERRAVVNLAADANRARSERELTEGEGRETAPLFYAGQE